MSAVLQQCRELWNRLSRLDVVALVVLLAGGTASAVDVRSAVLSFVKFLAVVSGAYLIFRVVAWGRGRLLWSLRNRLIVAYLFMAAVPVLLIITFMVLAGQFLYSQLGAYLLYEDLHRRIEMITDIAQHIAAAHEAVPRGVTQEELERVLAAQSHAVHDRELLGLSIEFSDDTSLLRKVAGPGGTSFAGLVQEDGSLSLVSLRELSVPNGTRIVRLRVPVNQDLLATIAPDLGAIQLNLTQPYNG